MALDDFRTEPMPHETRRVNLDNPKSAGHDPNAKLKQIAGLLQGLSYREMQKLGEMLLQADKEFGAGPQDATACSEMLLKVADNIMGWRF